MHVACTVQVPYRVDVMCKVCAPKPRLSPPPTKKQVGRRVDPQWKVGRPGLHFTNGVMLCLACGAYSQMGLQKVWLDGTPQVRKRAVVAHGNWGVHVVGMAPWESGCASATVIGGLPLPVRKAIFGLFNMAYRLVKRYGSFKQLEADAETASLLRGEVAPAYRSPASAHEIAHAIARPIRLALVAYLWWRLRWPCPSRKKNRIFDNSHQLPQRKNYTHSLPKKLHDWTIYFVQNLDFS